MFTLNGKVVTVCDVGNDPSKCYVNSSVSRSAYCIDDRGFFACVCVCVLVLVCMCTLTIKALIAKRIAV